MGFPILVRWYLLLNRPPGGMTKSAYMQSESQPGAALTRQAFRAVQGECERVYKSIGAVRLSARMRQPHAPHQHGTAKWGIGKCTGHNGHQMYIGKSMYSQAPFKHHSISRIIIGLKWFILPLLFLSLTGIVLGMGSANEGRRYTVKSSLIG